MTQHGFFFLAHRRGKALHPGSRRSEVGVSLIEVLVAVLVLSFGLLGLALLQLKGSQFTKDSGTRTEAFIQARSIVDAMRANPLASMAPAAAASTGTLVCPYCTSSGLPSVADACPASAGSVGTPQALAAAVARCDLALWGQRLAASMPGPASSTADAGAIAWDANLGMYTIRTLWTGIKLGEDDSGDASFELSYVP